MLPFIKQILNNKKKLLRNVKRDKIIIKKKQKKIRVIISLIVYP